MTEPAQLLEVAAPAGAGGPISLVSTYAYVNPLVAVFLGWALLSEEVTGVIAAGALAILASVALIVRR